MDRDNQSLDTELYCAYPPCLDFGSAYVCCTSCNSTYYCTEAHLRKDAERHQAECEKLPPPEDQSVPIARMLNVLLFPDNEDAPRVIQTECRIERDAQGQEAHHVDFPALLHTLAITSLPVKPVPSTSDSNQRPPGGSLYIACRDRPSVDDVPLNRSARALTGDSARTRWTGPLLGYRARELGDGTTQFEDVTVEDIPAFATLLKEYTARPSPFPEQLSALSTSISSVDVDNDLSETLPQESARPSSTRASSPVPYSGDTQAREKVAEGELTEASILARADIVLELRKVVWEETMRAMVTILLLLFALYGVWCIVVLPILSLPGLLSRALFYVAQVIGRACWRAIQSILIPAAGSAPASCST
ncbi:hypothetical protein C8Q77DRAFT_423753 [Trametes polyzona]|nr:hypothetical protein C8Q77DRAFT_423753 [Trametes polyzona]